MSDDVAEIVERLPLGFHPMSDVAWIDGRDLILFAHGMFVSARYCEGCWSEDTPISPAEYSGAVWSCFDDQFQFEIEEISHDPVQWWHGEVKGWADAAHLTRLSAENEALKAKLRMIVSHATGGALQELLRGEGQ